MNKKFFVKKLVHFFLMHVETMALVVGTRNEIHTTDECRCGDKATCKLMGETMAWHCDRCNKPNKVRQLTSLMLA